MKRINLIIAVALAAMATSCGTSKSTVATTTPEVATPQGAQMIVEGSDVIMYAESEPDRRAYGVGTHFQEATAMRAASSNARAALASAIKTMVVQSFDSYAGSVAAVGSTNGSTTTLTQDQVATMNEAITTISKECVTNTAMVKMERYQTKDNQCKVYVCVEHRLAVGDLVKELSEKVSQNVPQDIKDAIQYDQHLHEKKMEEVFQDYTPASY